MKCFMTTHPPASGEPFDDNYLHCDDCNKEHLGDCPVHGPMLTIPDSMVDGDDPLRALSSVPDGLSVQESPIPGAGLGVVAEIDMVKGAVLGPYEGKIVSLDSIEALKSEYCWEIRGPLEPLHCVDGLRISSSNWMRFVNCAMSPKDENVQAFQYKNKIFFKTKQQIVTGSELLVFYGPEFARKLGLDSSPTESSGTNDYLDEFQERTDATLAVHTQVPREDTTSPNQESRSPIPAVSSPSKRKRRPPPPPVRSSSRIKRPEPESIRNEYEFKYVVCDVCGLGFSCPSLLKTHVDEIHEQPLYTEECEFCHRRFLSPEALESHARKKHKIGVPLKRYLTDEEQSKRFRCEICGDTLKHRGHLIDHEFLKHGISVVYGCDQCQLKFDFFREIIAHQKTSGHKGRERIRVEPDADVAKSIQTATGRAPKKGVLGSLMNRTDRLRPLKCSVCPATFRKTGELRSHESKSHGVTTTYTCQTCCKEFKVYAKILAHHVDSGHKGTVRKLVGPDGHTVQPNESLAIQNCVNKVKGGVRKKSGISGRPRTKLDESQHVTINPDKVVHVKSPPNFQLNPVVVLLNEDPSWPRTSSLLASEESAGVNADRARGAQWKEDATIERVSERRDASNILIKPRYKSPYVRLVRLAVDEDLDPKNSMSCLKNSIITDHSSFKEVITEYRRSHGKCPFCNFSPTFCGHNQLNYHTMRCHGRRALLMCWTCRQAFQNYKGLISHQNSEKHLGVKNYFRPLSMAKDLNNTSIEAGHRNKFNCTTWRQDTRAYQPGCHVCPLCANKFDKYIDLKQHALKFHCVLVSYMCSQCEQKFVVFSELRDHQLSSEHYGIWLHAGPASQCPDDDQPPFTRRERSRLSGSDSSEEGLHGSNGGDKTHQVVTGGSIGASGKEAMKNGDKGQATPKSAGLMKSRGICETGLDRNAMNPLVHLERLDGSWEGEKLEEDQLEQKSDHLTEDYSTSKRPFVLLRRLNIARDFNMRSRGHLDHAHDLLERPQISDSVEEHPSLNLNGRGNLAQVSKSMSPVVLEECRRVVGTVSGTTVKQARVLLERLHVTIGMIIGKGERLQVEEPLEREVLNGNPGCTYGHDMTSETG